MTQTTTLDYAILGLLRGEALSGYAIRKIFETSAMGNYSSSPGAIYPALKRLEKLKLIRKSVAKANQKTAFQISQRGEHYLREWLQAPLTSEDVNKKMHIVLLKFAFFNTPEDIPNGIHFLKELIPLLSGVITGMNQFKKQQSEQVPLFGRLAFENGLDGYKAHLKWAKNSLKQLEANT